MNGIIEKIRHLNRQRNLKTKKVKNALKMSILYYRHKKKDFDFQPDNYKKILIFMHTNGLGDAIVTSGFINALRQNNKEVYIVAEKRISFLFKELIQVDGIYEFDRKNISSFRKAIKTEYFDFVVDFSDMDGTILYRFSSLCSINYLHSLSFNQHNKSLFDTNIIYNENKHISDRMLYVLKLLKIDTNKYHYAIHIPTQSQNDAKEFIINKLENNKVIIFNPFASEKPRSLSETQIYQVLDFLEQHSKYKTIVFDIHNLIDFSNYKNILANPFSSFITSAALVEISDLVITVDTSIVHLAQAFNKQQIAIYNNRLFNNKFSNNIVWGPNYENAKQVTTHEFLNTEVGDPMYNLNMDLVIEEIKVFMTHSVNL